MHWKEQGTSFERHTVTPRTLCFILNRGEVLLLRGAAQKRLWAGKLNGIGGHIECNETPASSARREVLEESGLDDTRLELRGVVHICSSDEANGIMLFVFVGTTEARTTKPGDEGTLEWHPLDALPVSELVEDLPELIPLVVTAKPGQMVYGLYQPDDTGRMHFYFEVC